MSEIFQRMGYVQVLKRPRCGEYNLKIAEILDPVNHVPMMKSVALHLMAKTEIQNILRMKRKTMIPKRTKARKMKLITPLTILNKLEVGMAVTERKKIYPSFVEPELTIICHSKYLVISKVGTYL